MKDDIIETRMAEYNKKVKYFKEKKYVGFWGDGSDPDLPRPESLVVDHWSEEERDLVVHHLTHNVVKTRSYRGWASCRICGKMLGTRDFSDGTYKWPEQFEHYLLEHSVKPPQEFIDHVLEYAEKDGGSLHGGQSVIGGQKPESRRRRLRGVSPTR